LFKEYEMLNHAVSIAMIAAVGVLVAPSFADFSDPAMPVTITRTGGYYIGNGGEFTLDPGTDLAARIVTGTFSDLASDTFQSFCVETDEYVEMPHTYYADINAFSSRGGVAGQDGTEGPNGEVSDSLDARTAYLFHHFRMGTLLTPYEYNVCGRSADAGALQEAIWYIENEVTSISGKTVTFYNEAAEATEIGTLYDGSATDGNATWVGLGDVRVLNLWANPDHTGFNQDQLAIVPAPGAALLGAIGLGLVTRFRRRSAA
jgi:hypothetical protein